MPRPSTVCPFTDELCTACRALFTEKGGRKEGRQMRGCQLIEEARKPSPSGALP